ncbi:MAG: ATP-binding cassette domain-containing protein [Bacteroidota bacterium]|jgi:ABC-2 type transport system ATP-binding protein
MSIELINISKTYGKQFALQRVNLTIRKGEVVGLLGQNGAGKSTLMKIISGYIPPTEGEAFVCEFNIDTAAKEAKKRIGYLPENNAMYPDMYVREYLSFIGELYKVKNIDFELNRIIQICGLSKEQNKKIGALSKGYKQRLGLAQALIHQPEVLILDEPTSGLDPIQLVEIRKLIQEIGKEKTVLLSTHIMQEVKAICSRIIIIDKGKIIADDLTEHIYKTVKNEEEIILELEGEYNFQDLASIEGIIKIQASEKNSFSIIAIKALDVRQKLFDFAVKNGLKIRSLQKIENSLEQIFQEITRENR